MQIDFTKTLQISLQYSPVSFQKNEILMWLLMRHFITDDRVAKTVQNILEKHLYHQVICFYFCSAFQNGYFMTFNV
jgi:hypothetical protein